MLCGTDCQQEIQALQAKDIASDQTLAACQGVQSAQCDQVRQQVRTAAAGYARSNDACVGPNCGIVFVNSPTGDGTVNYQSGKTQQLALGNMSGTTVGKLAGAGDAVGSAISGTADLAWTGIKAIWDPSARGEISANFDALGHVISTPSQWQYLAGALTPSQREHLAKDYESGDGYAASKALGEQGANILMTVLPGSDAARSAAVLNDGAKIGKAGEDVSKTGGVATNAVDDVLKPNGDFVGTVNKGATPNIRTVSAAEFDVLKNELLDGATVSGNYAGGKGTWYVLPSGGRVGVRTSDNSGVTLDIDIPGYPAGFKVHQQ